MMTRSSFTKEMLARQDCGSEDHVIVPHTECLVPVYLHADGLSFRPSLVRSSKCLVEQTSHLVKPCTVLIGIHASSGDAETACRTLKIALGCHVDIANLPDGCVATFCVLSEDWSPKSLQDFRVMSINERAKAVIVDHRISEYPSDIVLSSGLSHKSFLISMNDEGNRKSSCALSRAEEIVGMFQDDIHNEYMTNYVISSALGMPGAPVSFLSISVSNVIEHLEDRFDDEIDFDTEENRIYIKQRIEEEVLSPDVQTIVDGIICKISNEILFDIRKFARTSS